MQNYQAKSPSRPTISDTICNIIFSDQSGKGMCICDTVQPLQMDGATLEKFYGLVYVVVSHCGTKTPLEIVRLALSFK